MKYLNHIILISFLALIGCQRELNVSDVLPDVQINFGTVGLDVTVETKASEVTSLSSFYVSAVTGSAGSESSAWTSTQFTQVPASDPAVYTANKYWPDSDPSYKFYASNRPLTFSAEGTTVNATTATDVVCAYSTSNTYKEKNTLSFEHIFARVGDVTVVAVAGYSITDVNITMTPKTGGTYNLRTGAWSDITTGSATGIANSTPGTKSNDVYTIEGVITLTASWTATDIGGTTVSYTNKLAQVEVLKGRVNSITIALGGSITTGVDIAEYTDLVYSQDLEPLTFEALGDGDILWKSNGGSLVRTIEYSKDNGETWTSVTSSAAGTPIPVNTGDKVLIRGNNTTYGETNIRYCYFSGTVNYYVYGDVTNLLSSGYKGRLEPYCFYRLFNGDSYLYNHETKDIYLPSLVMGSYCYANMFQNCVNLSRAPALPAMSLAGFCYAYMFTNCPSLETTPELPATTLAPSCYANMFTACPGIITACELPATKMTESCYSYMFQGCSSLTAAPELPSTELAPSCYKNMFSSCSSLDEAPELPATELKSNCYAFMFSNCTGFTSAPELPATEVAEYCYYSMFAGCTGLVDAPVLSAMTMVNSCYMQMFYSCTSLEDAPQLPATTLANSCYQDMFANCSALTNPPALPATTLTTYVYYGMFRYCTSLVTAPELPATNLGSECYYEMFYGCSNLMYAPELPATVLQNNCYRGMFNRCTSLTTAPVLPASTLAPNCYIQMFYGCSSLNYIKALFTTTPVTGYTNNWVNGVAATGTFVKADDATWDVVGNYGVPTGWTIVNAGDEYLNFIAVTDGTITWTKVGTVDAKTIQYSKNGGDWTDLTSTSEGAIINVVAGDRVMFTGNNTAYAVDESNYSKFGGTAEVQAYGNVNSLLTGDGTTVGNYAFGGLFYGYSNMQSHPSKMILLPATTLATSCYSNMFHGCTSLTTAPELPATTLATYCYSNMFWGCTSLTTAPELPATTVVGGSYYYMFRECTSLITVPELPATALADYCYFSMFFGCTGLTSASELPATTLARNCYSQMFLGCASLTTAPELPATTLTYSCYSQMFRGCASLTIAPELPATTLANYCYSSMFMGCTSLITAPELPATTLISGCYSSMFNGCTSLTRAPELPATTLVSDCYYNMFLNCTSLNYIKALFTTTPSSSYTMNWVYGVAATGTFVKADDATWTTTGVNGVPTGWTVYTESTEPKPFSVSATKKVLFAPGNLQAVIGDGPFNDYIYTASEWKFAEHQWDYIGYAPGNSTYDIGSTVDEFGWVGQSSIYDSYGVLKPNAPLNIDYYGRGPGSIKTDWGSIPGVVSSLGSGWYTFSGTEVEYLLSSRTDASLKWGAGSINGTHGLILLPDDWKLPSNCSFTAGKSEWVNVYTLGASGTTNAWVDMEAAGAVFLPATGRGNEFVNSAVYYWCSTSISSGYETDFLYYMPSYQNGAQKESYYRAYRHPVRLVKEF